MGLYSRNTLSNLNGIEFPTVEGYVGTIGAGIALIEGYQNDFAMFQAGISGDFAEIAAMQEGADLLPLQEASIKGFFDKIIEFFKKLGAKIKAIFTTFAAKLSSYFTKDNKTFVKKYEKVVLGGGRDYSKMKAKYSTPKQNGYVYPKEYGTIDITGSGFDKDFDRDDEISSVIKSCISGLGATEISEISSEMHEAMYGDEEVKDDWNMGDMNAIANRLKNGSKTISDIEKTNKNLQDRIKKVISDINKSQTNFSKKLPTAGDNVTLTADDGVSSRSMVTYSNKDSKYHSSSGSNMKGSRKIEDVQKELTRMQSRASVHQSVILAFCSAVMKEAKFGIAQDRRIFAQAASFKNVTKEDTDLLAAIGEAVDFETESDFEAMEFVA